MWTKDIIDGGYVISRIYSDTSTLTKVAVMSVKHRTAPRVEYAPGCPFPRISNVEADVMRLWFDNRLYEAFELHDFLNKTLGY
jgi:hypothetical protein